MQPVFRQFVMLCMTIIQRLYQLSLIMMWYTAYNKTFMGKWRSNNKFLNVHVQHSQCKYIRANYSMRMIVYNTFYMYTGCVQSTPITLNNNNHHTHEIKYYVSRMQIKIYNYENVLRSIKDIKRFFAIFVLCGAISTRTPCTAHTYTHADSYKETIST